MLTSVAQAQDLTKTLNVDEITKGLDNFTKDFSDKELFRKSLKNTLDIYQKQLAKDPSGPCKEFRSWFDDLNKII
jgi:hypothetical protein